MVNAGVINLMANVGVVNLMANAGVIHLMVYGGVINLMSNAGVTNNLMVRMLGSSILYTYLVNPKNSAIHSELKSPT